MLRIAGFLLERGRSGIGIHHTEIVGGVNTFIAENMCMESLARSARTG